MGLLYLGESCLVGLWVILDGDLCRHATHGMHTPPMTGFDEQQAV